MEGASTMHKTTPHVKFINCAKSGCSGGWYYLSLDYLILVTDHQYYRAHTVGHRLVGK